MPLSGAPPLGRRLSCGRGSPSCGSGSTVMALFGGLEALTSCGCCLIGCQHLLESPALPSAPAQVPWVHPYLGIMPGKTLPLAWSGYGGGDREMRRAVWMSRPLLRRNPASVVESLVVIQIQFISLSVFHHLLVPPCSKKMFS